MLSVNNINNNFLHTRALGIDPRDLGTLKLLSGMLDRCVGMPI